MRRSMVLVFIAALGVASPLSAATISGTISDTTGGALKAARVTLRAIATGEETVVDTDEQGRYRFDDAMPGSYLVIVTRAGFSQAARTVVVEQPGAALDVNLSLELAS